MSSEEKRLEHHESKVADHVQAGKPVTTPDDNARLERQQKLEMAKVHRLTKDPSNQFQLFDSSSDKTHQVVQDFRGFAPEKVDTSKESFAGKLESSAGKVEFKLPGDAVQSSVDALLPPNSNKPDSPLLPTGALSLDLPSWLPVQPGLILPGDIQPPAESVTPGTTESFPTKWEPAAVEKLNPEQLHDLVEKFKHHDDNLAQPVDIDYAQEKQIGGKLYYELPDNMQVVQQGEDKTIHDRKQTEILNYVQNLAASPEKIQTVRDNSDTTNSAVTNTERTWINRPETVAHQLASEILHGDFEAFSRDRNVGKYHYTKQELTRLQHTFQESIAQAQFNIRHGINYTEAEANTTLHNIDYAIKHGLIDKAQCDGIKEKYLQKEQTYAREHGL